MNTCTICRFRKVRCDGVEPLCGQCARARPPRDCSYDLPTPRSASATLPKGAACFPCRQKKKKCDGERPCCKACIDIGSICKYDKTGVVFTPNQTPESFLNTSQHWSANDRIPLKILIESGSTSSSPQDNWRPIFSNESPLSSLSAPLSHVGHAMPTAQIPTQLYPSPSNEWNSQFRMAFLDHRLQLGLYFSHAKQQAIGSGDLSGSSISPFFVWAAQLFGCHFYRMRQRLTSNQIASDYLMQMEFGNLQSAIASLSSMTVENTSSTELIRAYEILATYYLYTNNSGEFIRYLANAKDTVGRESICSVLSSASNSPIAPFGAQIPWQEFTDEVHERATTLAQLIFVDAVLGTSNQQPPFYSQLRQQFRFELPSIYLINPVSFEICPIILRTRSVLFSQDVHQLISSLNASADWPAVSQSLFAGLSNHISALTSLMAQSDIIQERESCISLRYSMVISLTSSAELNQFLAASPLAPGQINFRLVCAQALYQIAQITGVFRDDEYYLLDQSIGECWMRAKTVAAGLCAEGWSNIGLGSGCSISLKSCMDLMLEARHKLSKFSI